MDLYKKLEQIILDNLSDEKFGVGELAEKAGMSRSTLLRKLQKEADLSASKLIRKVRLEKAKEFLINDGKTVSEISFIVGFSSTSYFIKCFREEYGVSPGELQKSNHKYNSLDTQESLIRTDDSKVKSFNYKFLIILLISVFVVLGLWLIQDYFNSNKTLDKSVAVLPFKNNSEDYANIYLVNGLRDAVLNNIQNIKDLKVISRRSVEQYRNTGKSIKEIADELDVSYIVEGSGQKYGQRILLTVQLFDGKNDKQIWSQAYEKELVDIFKIQRDIAELIAKQLNAIITPEEKRRLEQIPTENIDAYDSFLQGLELLYKGTIPDLEKAIPFFEKAIELDDHFARAYAAMAMSYYYLDLFKYKKENTELIDKYAEIAHLLEPDSPQALIAKAFSYMNKSEYETAVSYLEKALEYNPNSAFALNFLSDFYTNYVPNTEKYLEYSLKGLQLDKSSNDSTSLSYIYLHLSNAFLQTGFLDQATKYINYSLNYNSNNIYSQYVKAYIDFAKDLNIEKTNKKLIDIYQSDTNRVDVIQEVAKTFYNMHDYENAWLYYKMLLKARKKQNTKLFMHENIKIAWTCKQLGLKNEEKKLLEEFKEYTEIDNSIYKPLLKGSYYAYIGDVKQAINYMKEFSNADNFHFWILFLPEEPHLENISKLVEFDTIMKKLENNFWERHEKIKVKLQNEGLI